MQTLLEKHDDFDIEISLIYNILFLIYHSSNLYILK